MTIAFIAVVIMIVALFSIPLVFIIVASRQHTRDCDRIIKSLEDMKAIIK